MSAVLRTVKYGRFAWSIDEALEALGDLPASAHVRPVRPIRSPYWRLKQLLGLHWAMDVPAIGGAPMGEEFEDRDLSDAVFWGVRLNRTMFRDVDFTGVRGHHVFLTDVEIDGFVDGLVVNGVDVTDYVNAHDPWQPLRGMLLPSTASGVATAWEALSDAWAQTIEEATTLAPDDLETSVDREWSLLDTLRHLAFVRDKWILDPLSGAPWQAIGLSNTGSRDFPWPGIDLASQPTLDDVLAVRRSQGEAIDQLVRGLRDDDLERTVVVVENGQATALDCWHTLLEEEFEHRRYALRDLAILRPDQFTPTGAA